MNWKKRNRTGEPSSLLRTILLASFFLVGIGLGQVLAKRIPAETGQELSAYLHSYMTLESGLSPQTLLSALVLYLRYPLLAALLGFSSIGFVLLPGLTVLFGLCLSFSVHSFAAAFGPEGVYLALAVFGLRCVITLPCYLLLAVPAWETAAALSVVSFGGGRRTAPVTYGRVWWRRFGVCVLVLLAGVCGELFVTPQLLSLALTRVLA